MAPTYVSWPPLEFLDEVSIRNDKLLTGGEYYLSSLLDNVISIMAPTYVSWPHLSFLMQLA